MKKLFVYTATIAIISVSACTGNNKTGGDKADSGETNVGSSGAADTTAAASSSTAVQRGTAGTDTSSNGKGTATPTVDTPKTNPK
ncbi:hypothetical protein [Mucilaginibacter glaciei]|uniref:Uncharacterized protein n=1 Tax=Mucilaginibacter glaciei TaxID=2772109 RepID=A0A926NLT5_9SPHI|nr:hypothetical protein [Mucilaginibacter glaciei]MBD1393561.1 hypothetical protein [Mucilaginibacter glaciei]